MHSYIISEGQPTAYGGRTVRLELREWNTAHSEPWRADDDLRLLTARNVNQSFSDIAQALGRTTGACRSRYQAIISRERRA